MLGYLVDGKRMRLRSFGERYSASGFYKGCKSKAHLRVQWEALLARGIEGRVQTEELLLRGVEESVRPKVWAAFARFGMDQIPQYDPALAQQVTEVNEEIILKDVPRTFAGSIGNDQAEDKLPVLRRILEVYSVVDKDIGYTQGMNFVLSILLLELPEEAAFQTFYCMLNNPAINIRDFYQQGLAGFFEISRTWLTILEKRYRWVWKKLQTGLSCDPALTVVKCFQSILVAMDVPLELKLVMFDRVIVCGKRALVSFHLALIRIFSGQLQSLDSPDMQEFLLHVDQHPALADYDLVIDAWNKEWISEQEFASP